MRWKMSIAYRMFVALLLAMVLVAVSTIGLTRWALFDQATAPVAPVPYNASRLVAALAADYRAASGWAFLPGDREGRDARLRRREQDIVTSAPGIPIQQGNPGSEYRLGLVDPAGNVLAGATPSRALVVLASIDRRLYPVVVDGRTVATLMVSGAESASGSHAVAFLIDNQRNIAAIAWIALVLSALAAGSLAASFRRPIARLLSAMHRLEQGQLDTRLDDRRRDEFGELASSFNHLATRLDAMEASRRLWVADTSHELRTPLAVLRAQIEGLQDGVREVNPAAIDAMHRQVMSLGALVDDLAALARSDVGLLDCRLLPMNPWPIVAAVFEAFAPRLAAAGLTASLAVPDAPVSIRGDEERLGQLWANVLENALRYTDRGGRIVARGENHNHAVVLVIEDSSPGVPEPMLARLGERFFRADESRSRRSGGSGLGLARSLAIAAAHRGTLAFATSSFGGLCVRITLPTDAGA
jgi:two-component system sensor histidine kinase BaeS